MGNLKIRDVRVEKETSTGQGVEKKKGRNRREKYEGRNQGKKGKRKEQEWKKREWLKGAQA